MRAVRAFLFGALVTALVVWAGLTTIALSAQSAGREIDIGIGPLVLLHVVRGPDGTETTFGVALLVVTVVGGLVNALAAALLARRRRDGQPIA